MLLTQYYRIEERAGGIFASERELIRAFRSMLSCDAKKRQARDVRRAMVFDLLEHNDRARDEYYRVMRGQYLVQLDNQIGGE